VSGCRQTQTNPLKNPLRAQTFDDALAIITHRDPCTAFILLSDLQFALILTKSDKIIYESLAHRPCRVTFRIRVFFCLGNCQFHANTISSNDDCLLSPPYVRFRCVIPPGSVNRPQHQVRREDIGRLHESKTPTQETSRCVTERQPLA